MNNNALNNSTKQIVTASMLAALICIATMIIKIPSPLSGYLNLGDCMVLLAGWILPPLYGFLAAGMGSAFADLLSGYAIYAPPSFFIKGSMALAAFYGFNIINKKAGEIFSRIISGTIAETVMISGYLLFESFLYGFGASLVNIPANTLQGIIGLTLGITLIKTLEKANIFLKR